MLSSYRPTSGIPSITWLVMSGPGVTMPAIRRIATSAWRLYFLMKDG